MTVYHGKVVLYGEFNWDRLDLNTAELYNQTSDPSMIQLRHYPSEWLAEQINRKISPGPDLKCLGGLRSCKSCVIKINFETL